jgi:saccharopine dehydrogenase (NAD+, L-lysine-forming)
MTTHIWLRAESKPNERRVAVTPKDAARLIADGFTITVGSTGYSAGRV